jgi:hypothetical protein
MAITPLTPTKDVWTKVLTNVTYTGQVIFEKKEEDEPTSYKVYFVPTGDSPPAVDVDGSVTVEDGFSPSNSVSSDYYIMPKNNDGKIVVYT